MSSDTIAAISTPLGVGGIGIIRISGEKSREIGEKIFKSARKNFKGFKPYVLHHGWIIGDKGEIIDEVLISYMPAPGSYTGEDVVEINCHGGPAVIQSVLEIVIKKGARLAKPGEFTLRAFLNGRIDLSQAEAICEMVSAVSYGYVKLASSKLTGKLEEKIKHLKHTLEEAKAEFCFLTDFPEEAEEDEAEQEQNFKNTIDEVIKNIKELIENFSLYKVFREGAKVVLVGPVNAGKSSLFNVIIGRKRAIVTDIPGTTRDYIEEVINLDGVAVKLIDTAGIRKTEDKIELEGVKQGRQLMESADLVCVVCDRSEGIPEDLEFLIRSIDRQKSILVLNKSDLPPSSFVYDKIKELKMDFVEVSAKTGKGIDDLILKIKQKILKDIPEPKEDKIVPNLRQTQALKNALKELEEMKKAMYNTPIDLLTVHIDKACEYLSEITGEIYTEDVLDRVFSKFCIGK